MLKSLWNKVAYCREYVRQMNDETAIKTCEGDIAAAREGYRMEAFGNTYGAWAMRVDLTPEQSAEIIERRTQDKADAVARMEKRRAEYGLKF